VLKLVNGGARNCTSYKDITLKLIPTNSGSNNKKIPTNISSMIMERYT